MTRTVLRAALIFGVVTLASAPAVSAWSPAPAEVGGSTVDEEDCQRGPDLASREACYARLPASVIEQCESVRPFACAPYRDMHVARESHAVALDDLARAAHAVSAAYAESDPAYAGDLANRLREAEAAWAAWRDAECALAPLLDGMSRREFADLTEACRAEQTRSRIELLRRRAASTGETDR